MRKNCEETEQEYFAVCNIKIYKITEYPRVEDGVKNKCLCKATKYAVAHYKQLCNQDSLSSQ